MGKHQKTMDQHTVPESYLKFFMKEEHLFVLDKEKVKKGWNEFPKRRSAGGICYETDYYTIKDEYPENDLKLKKHDTHFVEDEVLTCLENKYPGLYQKIIADQQMSADDAVAVSDFITSLKLRNPYWFEKVIKKNLKAWTEKLLPELIAEKKKDDHQARRMPDEVFDLIAATLQQNQDADINYAKEFQLFSLIERYLDQQDRNKRLREKVIDCIWRLYMAPEEGPYFITTDNPGATVGTSDGLFHTIKLDGGFIFYFPLSYRYALVITDHDKDNAFTNHLPEKKIYPVPVNGELVNRINDILIQVAVKLLIAADDHYLNAIAKINKPK